MTEFNASEIFQIAIRIEENGKIFYQQMSEKMVNNDLKELFRQLADEEIRHQEIFTRMVSVFEDFQPAVFFPEEYFSYLKAYAEKVIFDTEKLSQEIKAIETPLQAVEFAREREWESISYYQEIKNIVKKDQHNEIEKIIKEEREHFLKLSRIKEILE